jgi:hypothetical protein
LHRLFSLWITRFSRFPAEQQKSQERWLKKRKSEEQKPEKRGFRGNKTIGENKGP